MQIRVKLFATIRQKAGWEEKVFDMPQGATVGDLYTQISAAHPDLDMADSTVYAAVNQEYAQASYELSDGDTAALFPPVSGGGGGDDSSDHSGDQSDDHSDSHPKLFEITTEALSLDDAASRVSRPDCGGITTFAGVVRGSTESGGNDGTADGPRTTDYLDYEAYTEMAEQIMARIGDEVMKKWPKVKSVCILHRVGRCEIGESSVVIAVAAPHRGDGCFEACQYSIERLKAIVPIWKQENWSDGQVWVEGPRQPELALEVPASSS